MPMEIVLDWKGPFSFLATQENRWILDDQDALNPGIYMWTVPINGKYLINYIGIATDNIAARQIQHLECFLKKLID